MVDEGFYVVKVDNRTVVVPYSCSGMTAKAVEDRNTALNAKDRVRTLNDDVTYTFDAPNHGKTGSVTRRERG